MIDAHCHLSSPRLSGSEARLVAEARALGVTEIIMGGVAPEEWATQRALAADLAGVHCALGLHPWTVAASSEATVVSALEVLEGQLSRGGVVALGEAGLDASSAARAAAIGQQECAFEAQIAMARRFGLPMVLHLVRAHEAALRILSGAGIQAAGGVVHGFSGSAEVAALYLGLGLHISVAGGVCDPRRQKLRRAVTTIPRERLLIETDAPDQTPYPETGPNRPAHLPLIAVAVAGLRGEAAAEVGEYTAANARRLFRLES